MITNNGIVKDDKYIFLYAAKGADPICVQQTEKSLLNYLPKEDSSKLVIINDPSYISKRDWEDMTKAIVIPGGTASEMASGLSKEGIQKIRNFINSEKGSCMGICAGGYLSGICEFDFQYRKPGLGKLEFTYRLNLVDRKLMGPALPTNQAQTVQISDSEGNDFHVFWREGGYYLPSFSDSFVDYACYQGDNNKVAVIGSIREKIVISNVHPEFQMDKFEIEMNFPQLKNVEQLANSIPSQKRLFATMCQIANI